MIRNAFTMKLKKGFEAEYKKRHDEIWPELAQEIKNMGISDYSIFLEKNTGTLFAVLKLSEDNTAAEMTEKPIVRKWWDYMADIMEVNPDNSPATIPLKEMFHMD